MYAQGAIDEYARVQKVPKNTIKKLTVAYDFKSNAWAAFTTVHVDGKPYQIVIVMMLKIVAQKFFSQFSIKKEKAGKS